MSSQALTNDILPSPFAWLDIPASKVTIAEGGYVPAGGQTFDVSAFKIAKYPITHAQYAKFIEAGGYNEKKWWTDAGWTAKLEGWLFIHGEWAVTNREWMLPRFWSAIQWNSPDFPVIGVSWYEAIAFCNWLNSIMEFSAGMITLPSEQQWQYAAQGNDNRLYPWGDDFDRNLCNSIETGIGKITSVTQYQGKGDSPFGVVDLVGNVWEWCLNDYDTGNQAFNIDASLRVLRGGSCFNSRGGTCSTYRDKCLPAGMDFGVGFRLVYNP